MLHYTVNHGQPRGQPTDKEGRDKMYNAWDGGPLDEPEPCGCEWCLEDLEDEYAHDNYIPESQVV